MSTEDISEYESVKKNWPKKQSQDGSNSKKQNPEAHRKEIRDRVGLKK
jgi:hypothetical protein